GRRRRARRHDVQGGYTIPHNKRWHTIAGKGLCATMWFWIFYRAKQDGAVLLGMRHPWDGHDDHAHGHGHAHEHEQFYF
uniref:NADH dehydrogenase [ubiquinone] 1 beta subcomplex subunit 2 n=1 Tax=Aegilops tauschii subsp. strangulata TaxID=200361 RepID=A0A453TAR8_AEGTS